MVLGICFSLLPHFWVKDFWADSFLTKHITRGEISDFQRMNAEKSPNVYSVVQQPRLERNKNNQDTQRNAFWLVLCNKKPPKSIPLGVLEQMINLKTKVQTVQSHHRASDYYPSAEKKRQKKKKKRKSQRVAKTEPRTVSKVRKKRSIMWNLYLEPLKLQPLPPNTER